MTTTNVGLPEIRCVHIPLCKMQRMLLRRLSMETTLTRNVIQCVIVIDVITVDTAINLCTRIKWRMELRRWCHSIFHFSFSIFHSRWKMESIWRRIYFRFSDINRKWKMDYWRHSFNIFARMKNEKWEMEVDIPFFIWWKIKITVCTRTRMPHHYCWHCDASLNAATLTLARHAQRLSTPDPAESKAKESPDSAQSILRYLVLLPLANR